MGLPLHLDRHLRGHSLNFFFKSALFLMMKLSRMMHLGINQQVVGLGKVLLSYYRFQDP